MKVNTVRFNPKHIILSLLAITAASQASFAVEFNTTLNKTFANCELVGEPHHENNHFVCGNGETDLHADYTEVLNFSNVSIVEGKLNFTLVVLGKCHGIRANQTTTFGSGWSRGRNVNDMVVKGTGCVTSTLPLQVKLPDLFRGEIKKTGETAFNVRLNADMITALLASVKDAIAAPLAKSIAEAKGPMEGLVCENLCGADRNGFENQLKGNIYQAKILERAVAQMRTYLSTEFPSQSDRSLDFLPNDTWATVSFELDRNNAHIVTYRN